VVNARRRDTARDPLDTTDPAYSDRDDAPTLITHEEK